MGWFSRLLSIFRQTKVDTRPERYTIHLHDFSEWLDVQKHHLLEKHKMSSEVLLYTNKMKAKRWELECQVDEWQNRIPLGKADDVNHFFVSTRKLLDEITFSDDLVLNDVLDVHGKIDEQLNELIQEIEQDEFVSDFSFLLFDDEELKDTLRDTLRDKDIARRERSERNTIDKEIKITVNPLLKELLDMRRYNDEFTQKVTLAGLTTIENLQQKKVQIEQMHETLTKLKNKEKLMQERVQRAHAIKEEKENELAKFKEEPLYQEVSSLEAQRNQLRRQREDLETEIIGFFSKLMPVLRKYVEQNPHQLVQSYLEDPSVAFGFDENLNILHVFEHLQASLLQNKIPFETEKLNSYLELIKKARTGYLEDLHKRHRVLHQELEGPSIPLKNRDFVMKLEEARYREEHFSKHLDEIEEKRGALEEELENYQERYDREVQLLQDMVKMGLGKEVTIKTGN